MPAYSRQSSAWTRSIFRQRKDASNWSGDADLGFVRKDSAWVQFQAPVGAALGQPISLVAAPGDLDATVTWTNDLAASVDTDVAYVQYRLPETTAVWTEEAYPITSANFGFLTASTTYQFQVRYITRDATDGQIDAEGPISELFFTTTALSGPGTPAADPGGTGGDSIVNWPILDGGGAVGGAGCWYEYIVQDATTPASGAITWADTAVTGSFDGDAGELAIDFATEGIACGELIRFKYRENCNGVTGDYQFGDPFVHVCDWDVTCGGVPASTDLNSGVYDDANCLLAFPELCSTTIRDTVDTTIELGRLPGFGSIQTIDGPHTVYGKTTNGTLGKPTLAGKFGALALLVDGDDFSASVKVRLEEVPGGSGGGSGVAPASFPVVRYGRNVAISVVFSTTTTFKVRCSWIDTTGSFQSVTSTSSFALDTYYTIALTMDANGNKILYVAGDVEDTNIDATAMAFSDAGIGQDVEVYTNEFMRVRSVAAWDRVLTASEVSGIDVLTAYAFDVERGFGTLTTASGSSTVLYEDALYDWYMPEVTGDMTVTLQGSCSESVFGAPTPGLGARVQATTDNTAIAKGTQLKLEVGAYSTSNTRTDVSPGGGACGTGSDSGSGGGATYLSESPFAEANRLLVAGGGGGETWGSTGASGGNAGLTGGSAADGVRNVGSGGTQIAGGTAGSGGNGNAQPGTQGIGGAPDDAATNDGGAGGGGWYGGGGGGGSVGTAEAGGGGSSYIDTGHFTLESDAVASTNELGRVGFTYTHKFQAGLLEIFSKDPKVCFGFIDPIVTDDREFLDLVGNAAPFRVCRFAGYSNELVITGTRSVPAPDGEAYALCTTSTSALDATSNVISDVVPQVFGPSGTGQTAITFFKGAAFPASIGAYPFSLGQSSFGNGIQVHLQAAGTIRFEVGSVSHTTVATYDDNAWHMVALTHDTDGSTNILIDGVSVDTDTSGSYTPASPSLFVWCDYGTERPPTDIAQGPMAFYDRALTPTEVSDIYNAFMAL